ncbi:lysosome-associated membrane glycoprotein 3 isoform X2 [Dendropsophus ebraccatus]|uniref:lysosome-associated membrane glycoprotein 3 isoform X2 n=1 Tax=Dendropsophus ebraccatus TaxID=150705 RepID=UPI003831DD1E
MAGTTLIVSFILLSGTFLVNTSAQTPSTIMQNMLYDTSTSAKPSNTTKAPSSSTTHTPSNTTSHAPSNTTTHAPSNTTTHAPSNTTTHAPSNTTTHAPSNTTTHAPSNTTTHAPFNTTTPTIHTTTTLPPRPSPPEIGNYTVKNGKGVCIIADMGLEIQIQNSSKGKPDKIYFNIEPKQTKANGECGDSKSNLLLQFPEGSINFVFVKEGKIYYIEEVSVQFKLASDRWNSTSGKLKLLSTDVGYFVTCKRTPTVQLGDNMQLILAEVKLQAFDIQDGKFGKEETCSYDRNTVAVAIAIVVVVIIVVAIVLYFIWHRRRSTGYERL